MRVLPLLLLVSGCSVIRDLDYLGEGSSAHVPDLCPGAGWCVLPNTKLRPECPNSNAEHDYNYTCPDVIAAHNGAVYDSAGRRLVIWGANGGSTVGHAGNEVYALSLVDGKMSRLNDPSST